MSEHVAGVITRDVSLSGCATLAAWHVTGRLTCPTAHLYIQVQYPNVVVGGAM
jgi:hypothetical protein